MLTILLLSLFFGLTLSAALVPVFRQGAAPELLVSNTTYLVLAIPAVAVANMGATMLFVYVPLRRLFYSIERALQRFQRAREAAAAAAAASSGGVGSGGGARSMLVAVPAREPPQSAMVDTEGARGRGLTLPVMDAIVGLVQLGDLRRVCDNGFAMLARADTLLLADPSPAL